MHLYSIVSLKPPMFAWEVVLALGSQIQIVAVCVNGRGSLSSKRWNVSVVVAKKPFYDCNIVASCRIFNARFCVMHVVSTLPLSPWLPLMFPPFKTPFWIAG
jgi:hypothetical protein